jgi:hypothetical protein
MSYFIQLLRLLTTAFQGIRLANIGIDLMFVMVEQNKEQNATEDISLGKIWSTPGLQEVCLSTLLLSPFHDCIQMFKELSLSEDQILAAARMHS